MLEVEIGEDAVRVGGRLTITFQRTLRVPDDGNTYPLPPGLGRFPTVAATPDEARRMPGAAPGDALIPMHQGEALWLGFDGPRWKPAAVKVAAGTINVLTGEPDGDGLTAEPQNYLVCPPQPWLDGINVGSARIRQFVATALGRNDTVEGQMEGDETGGIRLTVYDPKPGLFPDTEPPRDEHALASSRPMGLGAGGSVVQRIYPDRFGIETWDEDRCARITVHILNTTEWKALTGRPAPPSPITAETYIEHGLPWFELYDESLGDIPAAGRLKEVKSIDERERDRRGTGEAHDSKRHAPGGQAPG